MILITSSITGNHTSVPGTTHYAASKAGVNGLIRGAALELAKYNITVNGVEPGSIMTEGMLEMIGEGADDFLRANAARVPLGRLGAPDDVGLLGDRDVLRAPVRSGTEVLR